MHRGSYIRMLEFRKKHLLPYEGRRTRILDIGSQDVNGSYRTIFDNVLWSYTGADLSPGRNVDLILNNPYSWSNIQSESVDIVVSGQAFEHIEFYWITMLEISRVLRPKGLCCILAPSSGPEHRYPVDCWRFYPDGMRALSKFSQMDVVEVSTQWEDEGYEDGSDLWHDTMMVCRKPDNGFYWNLKSNLKRWLQHRSMTIGMR